MDCLSRLYPTNLLEFGGLLLFGYIVVYKPLRLTLRWLKNKTCACCKSAKILKPEANDYAIVTGATDGIGLEYAKQLAEKGFKLLLLSRTEEKLERVAKEIEGKYQQCGKVDYLAVDFTRTDIYERIKSKIESLDGQVYILVNNVGTMHPIPELFTDYPDGFNVKQINTNIVSVTAMSEMVMRMMLQKPQGKRPRGVVINISSSAGQIEIPLFNVYGATKAFVNYLGSVLATEYASHGIIVQTVTPNQVVTNMSSKLHEPAIAVQADDYVRHALRTVGTETLTNAHPKHKFVNNMFLVVQDLLCKCLFDKLMLNAMLAKNKELKEKEQKQN